MSLGVVVAWQGGLPAGADLDSMSAQVEEASPAALLAPVGDRVPAPAELAIAPADPATPRRAAPASSWLAERIRQVQAAEAAASATARTASYASTVAAAQADPQSVARGYMPQYGWDAREYGCLQTLWVKESDWRYTATNPSSGAYGIPQSLPANKMATIAADWKTNPVTQIRWGLGYIKAAYGTPCSALTFHRANNWY